VGDSVDNPSILKALAAKATIVAVGAARKEEQLCKEGEAASRKRLQESWIMENWVHIR
jgi:hypothetical protein